MPDTVYELRQYTLHPGQRDVLIDLFDREFVESQEAVGCRIVGQFRDLDRPDRFVWVRGFRDMSSRAEALTAFYTGPVWRAHAAAANATMVDCDDVLLLRPALPGPAFPPAEREPVGAAKPLASVVGVTLYHCDTPVDGDFVELFTQRVEPALVDAGAKPLARLQTEPAENNFPALPVRAGEQVFAWFSWFADEARHREYRSRIRREAAWPDPTRTEELRLSPTARSALR
jgi:quinol monooxygenase YgiN